MAHLGVVACIQPGFAHSDAATARAGLGPARMEHAYRWDRLLDAGVRVISGSDYPIEALSPLDGLAKLADQLDLDTALALMTDAEAGTTVLSADPHDAPFADLEVEETVPA
jgi:predicted amidohydrolase YtcJ